MPPAAALPPAGQAGAAAPQTAPPRVFADEAAVAVRDAATGEPVAGWHGSFFLRDPGGHFRFSPTAILQLDLHSSFGTNVDGASVASGGAGLPPRFFARRVRMGFMGDLLDRWSYQFSFDLANGSLSNPNGTEQGSAAPAGLEPTSDTARFRPVQVDSAAAGLRDAWINYGLCGCLNFQFGQIRPPVSMECRTVVWATPLMERSLASRTWIVPQGRETGLNIWGDFGDDFVSYEVMVAGGDGTNRGTVDGAVDVMGRVLVEPLQSIKLLKRARIGMSARHGERDPAAVGYDVTPISTNQGFALWSPTYSDSLGRRIHVLPSGAQNLIGGEVYLPVGPVDIAAEAYYADYGTREAVDGYQLTNTERLGTLRGTGLTSWVTWWAFGNERVGAPVGRMRPNKLALGKKVELERGLELTALFSAVLASYDGNARGGTDDARTPGSAESPTTALDVFQFAGAASYWHTRSVRLSLNYALYHLPGSSEADGLARVPGNLVRAADPSARALHELGTRVQLFF
jgi:hypothetical protein